MAIDMQISIRNSMSRHPNILFRRKTYAIRRLLRYALRKMPQTNGKSVGVPHWNDFAQFNTKLQSDGYVFVENFLSTKDAELLKQNWPKNRYFTPIAKNEDHKTSDKGLLCDSGEPSFDTKRNVAIWALYQMFLSKKFTDEVTKLCGDGIDRYPYHLLSQNSYLGSGLAPHRDSEDERFKSKLNFIYFVESNGTGWEAGGTAMLKSNSFDEPIFIPTNLNNSCLFYYSETELFHVFPSIKFGKYRRNVIAHFCAK